jgi:hypothetical protein
MTNKDKDQDWLDALAGKPSADADPEVSRRATLMRQAIQRHDSAINVNEFNTEAGLQKLKFRMQREGLSGESKPAFFSRRFVQYAMAASIVLTVGLSMRLYLHEQPIQNEEDIMRGSEQQIVLATDPEARLKQLTTELDRLGIKYKIERKEEKILLKAQGVDPVKDDVAGFLERNHIKPPVGTDVELDIRPLTKP